RSKRDWSSDVCSSDLVPRIRGRRRLASSTSRPGPRGSRRLLLPAPKLAQQPDDRVEAVRHPLLERADGVVRDADPLGAHLGATLGDVAEADTGGGPNERGAIARVERVHLERRELDEEAGPREGRLVLLVIADHVADVLAQEALDALVELLDAIDLLLHHPVR